ncbi:ribonuclease E activity regulator RraA [Xanthomonas hortorum]|uniref:ribonuclease E activity regulator RraA n=1 Tax=Xanthomonas hortorum TaxID=56454 RepID=UPI0015D65EBB|nr:ribonuclease E activity regulator RraA [Xanthomonas hortorum]MCE4359425.1 ribonuclease E activity regulator RraA [Xanthomonas hortorum pv. taraxaci]NMI53642.1 putative 4-hydroxy-4-methyl-2-oxoglutarate aldolase [Xanthomonas hortorum pv. taraxaci]CAD0319184.1 Putative 4-hydroxy-4-methyl-2-oxoglutarate aldolase [Xanthomonas hortorum pv. taraxaci]CAD0319194.1 Putative 4-hydroxy-4-methyl-2-oxoglutarate aldolase [Xanthomonas hortorum pv. taraxaci]
MTWTTPDLCDRFPEVHVAEPLFRHFGGRAAFSGPIATVRCFEDNSRVRELAATLGDGRVLVVDGQGSLKHALLGDQIAAQAVANGWAGVLIHGCVRDVEILATLPLGVLALGACPRRTERRDLGEVEVPVNFAGVAFVPGHWLYADANGVLVAALPLSLDSAGGPI